MRTIRFSHPDYEKFRRIAREPPFTARLLQVFLLPDEDISDAFREYDTKYYTERGDTDYYVLEGRLWIVLLFETEGGLLFTTMRSASTPKLQYYRHAQGEDFRVVTKGEYVKRGQQVEGD